MLQIIIAAIHSVALAVVFAFLSLSGFAQEITSRQSGPWNVGSTWSGGIVPTLQNSSRVVINHNVSVPSAYSASVSELLINDSLTVESLATLILVNGTAASDLFVNGHWVVAGVFVQEKDAVVSGTSKTNTKFLATASYYYRWNTAGILPVVSWDPASTFFVTAFNTNISVLSDTWSQEFGNFIYDCPAQGSFMDFNGRLKNVQGDLTIRNTNNHILRLGRGQSFSLMVGGTFLIEGPSEVWLGETGNSVIVTIANNFEFRAQATASSYFTLSGKTHVNVEKDFIVDTNYKLKFASSGGGSSELHVGGNFNLQNGTIDALGSGKGTIVFDGDSVQQFIRSAQGFSEGNFYFTIEALAHVSLGTSLLYNTTGGSLDVFGTLAVGSSCNAGALQSGVSSNTSVVGGLVFHPGSRLEFNGVAKQFISSFPGVSSASVDISNDAGVELVQNISIAAIRVQQGDLNAGNHVLTISGDVTVASGRKIQSTGLIILAGINNQQLDLKGSTVSNLTITGTTRTISVLGQLAVSGLLTLEGSSLTLNTNDSLSLLSTSVTGGGRVGLLTNNNVIVGQVRVERFMPAGRVYRYISSPVLSASVADLMDDFPVTGPFQNPSTGTELNSTTPSLFNYDESLGVWKNYPANGFAEQSLLEPGRGYAAFVRSPTTAVTLDARGVLNQGQIEIPVGFPQNATTGWNLVGNPYPCAIRWNNIGWIKQNISEGIAVRDNATGSFRIWDGAVGDLNDGVIGLGQAFWIRATAENPQLVISESVKQIDPATFYRRDSIPNFISVDVSQSGHEDRAYIRFRDHAEAGLDRFDIPKLKGDFVSVSALSADGHRLALSAECAISCVHEVKLDVASSNTTDSVSVNIIPSGNLTLSEFVLRTGDNGETIARRVDGRYRISPAMRTLVLEIRSSPAVKPDIQLPAYVCEDHIVNAQISNFASSNYFELIQRHDDLTMSSSSITERKFHFNFKREFEYFIASGSPCSTDTTRFFVTQNLPHSPDVIGAARCGPGNVKFSVTPRAGLDFAWYDATDHLVFKGEEFVTLELERTTFYRVRAICQTTSCESNPTTIMAKIEQANPLEIKQQGTTLEVNLEPPLEWFLDDKMLSFQGSRITIAGDGVYRARKTNKSGNCVSEASFTLQTRPGEVFPNPAKDFVSFNLDDGVGILTDVVSVTGVSVLYLCELVCSPGECRLDIRSLSSGTYFLIFTDKRSFFRTRIFVY